MNPLE